MTCPPSCSWSERVWLCYWVVAMQSPKCSRASSWQQSKLCLKVSSNKPQAMTGSCCTISNLQIPLTFLWLCSMAGNCWIPCTEVTELNSPVIGYLERPLWNVELYPRSSLSSVVDFAYRWSHIHKLKWKLKSFFKDWVNPKLYPPMFVEGRMIHCLIWVAALTGKRRCSL